jgi:hypothetical protein
MDSILPYQFIPLVDRAILGHWVVQIYHQGSWRTVEPYLVGLEPDSQAHYLYGYCRSVMANPKTGQTRWQLFWLSEIQQMELTVYGFTPQANYPPPSAGLSPALIHLQI